jgi:hypothetical protein
MYTAILSAVFSLSVSSELAKSINERKKAGAPRMFVTQMRPIQVFSE